MYIIIREKNYILSNDQKNKIKLININNSFLNNKNVIKRRSETFAEAEQRQKIKNIEVGILGPGEITGMCEIIFGMSSFMQSVRCLEDCDVYFIYKRSYDRLIAKRNPSCIKKMRENVYMKLKARNSRLNKSYTPVDLFRSIQYRIEIMKKNNSNNFIQNFNNLIINREEPTNLNDADISNESNSNDKTYKSAPRGSIIQLDLKTKSAAYSKLKGLLEARKKKQTDNHRKLMALSMLSQARQETTEEIIDLDSDQNILNIKNEYIMPSISNNNILVTQQVEIVDDDPANIELENLEDRIKKFQLELGCKKAVITKLNRIDVNVR
jgi:hypothetical protein